MKDGLLQRKKPSFGKPPAYGHEKTGGPEGIRPLTHTIHYNYFSTTLEVRTLPSEYLTDLMYKPLEGEETLRPEASKYSTDSISPFWPRVAAMPVPPWPPISVNEADVFPICKETTTYRIAVVESTNIEDYETNGMHFVTGLGQFIYIFFSV